MAVADDDDRCVKDARKTRVAILGGGPSALTCALYLTSHPELRAQYSVTIYTLGWKLGGKGSSGRGQHDRIEEHGLHVLFGAYHTFFRTIRQCYEELDRPEGHPLRTWEEAFKPHDFGVMEDYAEGKWNPWAIIFPRNSGIPGDRGIALSSGDYLSMAIQGSIEMAFGWRALNGINEATGIFDYRGRPGDGPDRLVRATLRLIQALIRISHDVAVDLEKRDRLVLRIVRALRKMIWPVVRKLSERNFTAHRFWLGLDFMTAFLGGIIEDGVLLPGGFAKIDHLDFREWLEKHGAHPKTLEGPWGRMIYDAAFSYINGDPKDQRIAAGVAAHLLIGFGMYRGSMYYKMQAGMGDTVFAPIYEVLKKRGVEFEFFRKVESLELSDDKRRIRTVRMFRQAKLVPGRTEYDPLRPVKGLPCWPAEPFWDQLADAEMLRHYDLEDYYDQPPDMEHADIHYGEHYDQLVYGIPIGAVPLLCQELLDFSPRWRAMATHVTSIQTLAFQIWTKPTLQELGWDMPAPLLSLYVEPLNTWADMSQVIPMESWPPNLEPRYIGYYTGPQPGPTHPPHPAKDKDFQRRMTEHARKSALEYMANSLTTLMPNATQSAGPAAQTNWNLLIDPLNREGEARFNAQYWRSNCGPSERCTIAAPGSTRHRMQAGDTGFEDFTITGDWIDNGIYSACMEGAFNAGVLAARHICKWPFEIDGIGYHITRGPLYPKRNGKKSRRNQAK